MPRTKRTDQTVISTPIPPRPVVKPIRLPRETDIRLATEEKRTSRSPSPVAQTYNRLEKHLPGKPGKWLRKRADHQLEKKTDKRTDKLAAKLQPLMENLNIYNTDRRKSGLELESAKLILDFSRKTKKLSDDELKIVLTKAFRRDSANGGEALDNINYSVDFLKSVLSEEKDGESVSYRFFAIAWELGFGDDHRPNASDDSNEGSDIYVNPSALGSPLKIADDHPANATFDPDENDAFIDLGDDDVFFSDDPVEGKRSNKTDKQIDKMAAKLSPLMNNLTIYDKDRTNNGADLHAANLILHFSRKAVRLSDAELKIVLTKALGRRNPADRKMALDNIKVVAAKYDVSRESASRRFLKIAFELSVENDSQPNTGKDLEESEGTIVGSFVQSDSSGDFTVSGPSPETPGPVVSQRNWKALPLEVRSAIGQFWTALKVPRDRDGSETDKRVRLDNAWKAYETLKKTYPREGQRDFEKKVWDIMQDDLSVGADDNAKQGKAYAIFAILQDMRRDDPSRFRSDPHLANLLEATRSFL